MSSLQRPDRKDYVAASFDGLLLLLDQDEVSMVEQAERIGETPATVHSLSGALRRMQGPQRPLFLIARHARGAFGLACDEVRVMKAGRLELHPLPQSLRTERSPFRAYASVGERIGFHCSAARLAALLDEESADHGER